MSKVFPIAMLVASPLCLAAGTVLAKAYVSGIDPVTFLVVQLGASVVFLWAIVVVQGAWEMGRSAVASLMGLGLVVGLASICTIVALRLTTASQASVIFATQPVLIAALAWLFLAERPTWALIALAFLALSGIVAVASTNTALGDTAFSGNLLALLSTALAAFYVVAMRKLTIAERPLTSLAIVQTTALGVAFLALPFSPDFTDFGETSTPSYAWAAAALSGILQYGLGYWLYLLGLQRVKAAVAGLYLNLVPLFVVSLAFVFLGELLSARQWVGAAVVLMAVVGISLLELFGRRADTQQPSMPEEAARAKSLSTLDY